MSTISTAAQIGQLIRWLSAIEVADVNAIVSPAAPTLVISPLEPDNKVKLLVLRTSISLATECTKWVAVRNGDYWKLRTTVANSICIEIITTIPHSAPVELDL